MPAMAANRAKSNATASSRAVSASGDNGRMHVTTRHSEDQDSGDLSWRACRNQHILLLGVRQGLELPIRLTRQGMEAPDEVQ